MSQRKADAPLSVEIPPQGADRPAWGKVGVITAIGFLVGVAWPRVAGVRLGPALPADAVAASAAPPTPPSSPALALPAPAPSPAPAPAPSLAPTPVSVAHGVIVSCKTPGGDVLKGADCGTLPGLDGLVMPHLRKLAECPQAAGATGKLHLNVRVDFSRETVGAENGRGTTVSSPEALVACAKTALADVKPGSLAHDNQRYAVAYTLTFVEDKGGPSAAPAAPAAPAAAVAPASTDAVAQVAWDVAIVRDSPKTGKIVARLDRGTSVRVGAPKEGWYPVKYGEGFASDGWVYRAAIGR